MATLNVKQVPDDLYARLREQAKRHRRSLAQEVVHLLEGVVLPAKGSHSLTELQGLGADLWRNMGMSVEEYIRKERDSWD